MNPGAAPLAPRVSISSVAKKGTAYVRRLTRAASSAYYHSTASAHPRLVFATTFVLTLAILLSTFHAVGLVPAVTSPASLRYTPRWLTHSPMADDRAAMTAEQFFDQRKAEAGGAPAVTLSDELVVIDEDLLPPQFVDCDVYKDAESAAALRKEVVADTAGGADDSMAARALPFSSDERPVFKVIVITFNRAAPLERLLRSLAVANYTVAKDTSIELNIFIDRGKADPHVDAAVLETSRKFLWPFGPKTVCARRKHVGLFGQWVDTWQPARTAMNEDAIILEDDLEVSPHYFQWLRSVRERYGMRSDVAGYTLQKGRLRAIPDVRKSTVHVDERHPLFFYRLLGSWGFAPRRESWIEFREWFASVKRDANFRPYVDNLLPTQWYKKQEGKGTMWTMHYIYFCNQRNLFTVYANLPNRRTLAANWQESGLHYSTKQPKVDFLPLAASERLPTSLPSQPVMLHWDGNPIKDYYS